MVIAVLVPVLVFVKKVTPTLVVTVQHPMKTVLVQKIHEEGFAPEKETVHVVYASVRTTAHGLVATVMSALTV
jgi:hypothetical protein